MIRKSIGCRYWSDLIFSTISSPDYGNIPVVVVAQLEKSNGPRAQKLDKPHLSMRHIKPGSATGRRHIRHAYRPLGRDKRSQRAEDTPMSDTSIEQDKGDDPVLSLDQFLPYQLNFLAEEVSRSFSRIYADQFKISIPEWRVVAILGQSGPLTAKTIGERSTMHKTKVSRAVAALEKRKFILRNPNSVDLRESFIELSESGQGMYRDLVPQAFAFNAMLKSALSEAERETLESIFSKLHQASQNFRRSGKALKPLR